MTQLKERALDQQKKESSCGVDTEVHAEKRGHGGKIDVVICEELFDPVNNEFLNQIGAVGDAGDECRAGNRHSTERESWTDRANKKRGHADGDEWKLPNTGRDGEVVGFAKIQRVRD